MNFAKLAFRVNSVFIKTPQTVPAAASFSFRKLQTTGACNSTERQYTKKVFTPAFGSDEVAKVDEEVVAKKRKTESDIYLESRQQKKKVRTFKKIDKIILVMVGKYKRIQDVPDQITYSTLEEKKEVGRDLRHLFLGSAFKYVYIFEYASFLVTGFILAFALYWYSKVKKPSKTTEASVGSEPKDG